MQRRRFITHAAAILAMVAAPFSSVLAHTPYRQWDIFRKRHLQILSSHSDLAADTVADNWVALLAEKLPLSRAMVSRARDVIRLVSLLKTDQSKLAILSYADADAIFNARGPYAEFKPMPLQLMLDDGAFLLVARDNLPLHHGFLIAVTLLEEGKALHLSVPLAGKFGMVVHPGAKAAALGEKIELPAAEEK
jgi:hypothetical protein